MPADDFAYQRQFYADLYEDGTIGPGDRRYVDLFALDELATNDEVQLLARHIAFSLQPSSYQLFTGYRGAGKSVELRRLKKVLEDDGATVLLFSVEDYLNVAAPVEAAEFLMALAFGIDETAAKMGIEPVGERPRWRDRVKDFLDRPVGDPKVTFNFGIVDIEAEMRSGEPTFRQQLHQALEGRLSALVDEVNGLVAEIVQGIRLQTPEAKVVVLVDSLDHARGGSDFHQVKESIRTLFEVHGRSLALREVHVVYTVPVYLKFLQSVGGGVVRVLRAVKVADQHGVPYEPGIDALTRMVAARAPEGDWQRLLGDEATLRRLILLSGGHLRDLLRLVAEIALRATRLPAPAVDVDRSIVEIRNQFLPIPTADQDCLRRVAETKRCDPPTEDDWAQLADLFDHHYVLSYQNGGDEWYDVHPILRSPLGLAEPAPS